ncbi:MAG: hypothetical protein U5J82_03410 [Desulfobacterales bacterium]|nr:hypothetical protein [Desulfobacterales bacterium]
MSLDSASRLEQMILGKALWLKLLRGLSVKGMIWENLNYKNVRLAGLFGANRDYILNRIPHISKLMVDNYEEVISHADVIVIGHADEEFEAAVKIL